MTVSFLFRAPVSRCLLEFLEKGVRWGPQVCWEYSGTMVVPSKV